jgi:hypothetical protein
MEPDDFDYVGGVLNKISTDWSESLPRYVREKEGN